MGLQNGFENGFDGCTELLLVWLRWVSRMALYDFREGFSYCRQKARFRTEWTRALLQKGVLPGAWPGSPILECHFPEVYS